MNIHFTDKKLFDKLKKATIAKVIVGSHMYGTNNENSDIDYLHIYATSENELMSFIQTNHQLQYKEEGIDYNFVSLNSFLKNIFNGDSSINFEVIQSDSLIGTDLEWLCSHKDTFITYNMIRSYLGLCRRDIKYYNKCDTDYDKVKKLRHIIRGYIYAKKMISHNFNFKECNDTLLNIKLDISTNIQLREYEKKISDLRNELTEKFNNKTLGYAQNINVEAGIKLNTNLCNFMKTNEFKVKQYILKDFDMEMFINSYENWVNY